jgi:hypothetical protein
MLNVLPNDETLHDASQSSCPRGLLSQIKACLRSLKQFFQMEDSDLLKWNPIISAPADVELELSIHDKSEYHALVFPCRRDGRGWHDVRANRPMPLEPTHWRIWNGKRA